MARKKHRRTKKSATPLTLQQRGAQAKNALENGHYKKAIISLKQLLKEDDRTEWREDALHAHSQLADQLSRTKKYREVVSLYESGAKLCGFSLYTFEYVDALLKSKQFDKAIRHYIALQDDLEKPLLQVIRAELAAYALTGEKQVINKLPVDDAVVIDYQPALHLLTAYCDTDDEQVTKNLRLLSFRSPYRDLRIIIAAAIKLDTDIDTGYEMLARIATDSPFSAFATSIELVRKSPKEVLSSWSSLSVNKQQLVKKMKGWGKDKDKLIKKLSTVAKEPAFTDVFRLADTFRSANVDYCYSVATKSAIHGSALNSRVINLKRFKKRFFHTQTEITNDAHLEALVATLAFEKNIIDEFDPFFDPFWELDNAWQTYVNRLETFKTSKDGKKKKQEISLKQALIYRYMMDSKKEKTGKLDKHLIDYLQKSLSLDPKDKESHTQLVQYYLHNNHEKKATIKAKKIRESVSLAVQHYPDDLDVLLLAIEAAISSKAFKKAAGYAQKILKVDPINREARMLLCQAHLAHSRKQIKLKKWHLVEKELLHAEQWANESIIYTLIAVQKAYMAKSQGHEEQAINQLQQAGKLADTDLNLSFLIRLELASVDRGREAKSLHQLIKLNWIPAKKQSKTVLFSLIETINSCLESHSVSTIAKILTSLSVTLNSIVKKDISLAEYEQILDFWQRTEQDKLSNSYIKVAIKHYGNLPLLTYYRYANVDYLNARAYEEVEQAIDSAREQDDMALVSRLIALLRTRRSPFNSPLGLPFDNFDDNYDDEIEDDFNETRPALDDLPQPLRETLLQLVKESDIDDVVFNMEKIVGISESEIMMLRSVFGDEGIRLLFIALLEGKNIDEALAMLHNGETQQPKPKKKKKKKGLFGLFDF